MKNHLNHAKENTIRSVYYAFIDIIEAYEKTNGYADCANAIGISQLDSFKNCKHLIRKARYDLNKKASNKLGLILEEIANKGQFSFWDYLIEEGIDMRNEEATGAINEYIEYHSGLFFSALCSALNEYLKPEPDEL